MKGGASRGWVCLCIPLAYCSGPHFFHQGFLQRERRIGMTVWEGLVTSVCTEEAWWLPTHCLEESRGWTKVRVEETRVVLHVGWAGRGAAFTDGLLQRGRGEGTGGLSKGRCSKLSPTG